MRADTGRLRTILFVEDIAETRRGMERLLKSIGYRVVSAADAESAVHVARESAPDLILIDLGVPSCEVLAVGREIRERALTEDVPVVVIASEFGAEAADQRVGACDYITYLADSGQLERLLARVLAASGPAVERQTLPSSAAALPETGARIGGGSGG